jgi:hypothetical protein
MVDALRAVRLFSCVVLAALSRKFILIFLSGFAKTFSCKGILSALNWFHGKGHEVYVIIPQTRLDVEPSLQQPPCVDQHIITQVCRASSSLYCLV